MKHHGTNCKICHRPITVSVADGYDVVGDTLRLLPMATCDACYDYMAEWRKLRDAIHRLATMLISARASCGPSRLAVAEKECETALTTLTRKYSELVARRLRREAIWDAEFVRLIMDRPDMTHKILSDYGRLYEHQQAIPR